MNSDIERSLDVVVGQKLTSVTFVMDYIKLGFNSVYLAAITDPKVKVAETIYDRSVPDFCNALVNRITKTVRAASVVIGKEIRIDFDDESAITISLQEQDYRAPEAAILSDNRHVVEIW